MTGPVVRRLTEDDVEAVAAALASRSPQVHRRHLEAQTHGGFVCLIAWVDGVPAGFAGVGLHEDASPEVVAESRGFATVSEVFVEAPHRRRGVGRALMSALEDAARAAGMPGVILDTGTDASFAPARALYRSLGYVDQEDVYLGGWSDPDQAGVHVVDPLTLWLKPL